VADLRDLKEQLLTVQIQKAEAELETVKRANTREAAKGQHHGSYQYVGGVEEATVHMLIGEMEIWSRSHEGEPCTISFNTQGGAAFDGFALFDYLRSLRTRGHHVTTRGIGLVASMGSILLQAGDHRVITPRSWMLIHEVQAISAGSFSKMEDDMKFNRRLQNLALDVYTERSNWSRQKFVKNWTRKDFWLSPEEALKAGLVDEIENTIDAGIKKEAK
jgi:ATP-dependent protease ClpP protease subunit